MRGAVSCARLALAGIAFPMKVAHVIRVGAPATILLLLGPRCFTLAAVLRVVAGDELVQVRALEEVGLQREVLVGAQVMDPELLVHGVSPRVRVSRMRGCTASSVPRQVTFVPLIAVRG